jgi:peptide-methionine (S)-S-oxide reductase
MKRYLLILTATIMTLASSAAQTETATLGGGCFWCTEAIFRSLKGVETVESGYSGGHTKNPTYQEVCTGETGHAEVIQITFNPQVISFTEILEVFFETHDPTSLNRQGADAGTQYRSVVFYHTPHQKELAEKYVAELNKEKVYGKPVVTEVVPFEKFYKAENYHQNYFANNRSQGYCQFVIVPKIEKFRKIFKDKLK